MVVPGNQPSSVSPVEEPAAGEESDRLADAWAATARLFLMTDDDPTILETIAANLGATLKAGGMDAKRACRGED